MTFLLTDVVASTRLWQKSASAGKALALQADLIRAAVAEHGGVLPPDQGEGDSTLSVFARPGAALAAALAAQRALLAEPWPGGATVTVRMAVHTGEAELTDSGNYGGLAIIRAARLRGLAKGGQVLVSSATAALVADSLPDSAALAELGSATLPGFERPERIHQLIHPELPIQPGRLGALQPSGTSALGAWPTRLVGRERERHDLGLLLAKGRLVTITGSGGAGKTRLAHAVAQDSVELHPDGVVWVELARVSDGAQVAAAVVAACGLVETPGATAVDVLTQRLAKADLLVVLDNCEHLLTACAELADALLRAGPEVRVLATAREPLGVAGEVMWRIPSLSVPAEDERALERIAAADAVQLFVERARASRPDFALDPANAPFVAGICRRLDGIPLALELAAARVRALSVDRLATGLDDRFRLLTGGARTAVARQRTLLASVEWSYDLLSGEEQALFRRLAVFAAPFSLEAAEAVAAGFDLDRLEVFDLLARLVDKSLVLHGADRYRMLETLRHFGLERADDAGELELVRDRHLTWFRRRCASWAVDREIFCEPAAAEIEAAAPELIAALDWSLGRDRAATLELLQPLGASWPTRFANDEARAVSSRVLRGLEVGSSEWLAAMAPLAGPLAVAGDLATLSAVRTALAERSKDIAPTVRCQLEIALSFLRTFQAFDEGIAGLLRAIDDARSIGNRALEVLATNHLAMMSNLSDVHAARRLADWLDRQLPADATLRSNLRFVRAGIALNEGDLAGARTTISHTHQGSLPMVVSIALATGDRSLLRDTLAVLDHLGSLGLLEGIRDLLLGVAAVVDGDLETARGHLRSAARMPGVSRWIARVSLARTARALGDDAESEASWLEVERESAGTGMNQTLTALDLWRAARARRHDAAGAEGAAHAGLARALRCGFVLQQVDALEILALIQGDTERLAEAGRLVGAADAFRARSGYKQLYPTPELDELRRRVDAEAMAEGARLSLPEAVEYARRGRGGRSRPDHGWESLTPTESRVVELVAEGLPNKEIAAKLFVSLATVKTHLAHVYTKLDVRGRTELAARATRLQAS
ncbi:MAG TPA: LuxR C-terminal-related transcriptional regulator [Myxococcota bacterium]|nr:LuxR C-terminal-related transcriptional regulator [Myxococcota bacterium]